ncbi:hypothetical protein D3C86_2080080 [compost metagenome]
MKGILGLNRNQDLGKLRITGLTILNFRRFSSPKVPNGLVILQDVLHLIGQVWVDFR